MTLPELFLHFYDRDALPTAEESRQRLSAMAEAELARARALEIAHRELRDDPDRAEAASRALILPDGPSARLFLRYHAEARTSFHRAYGSLVKALELDATADSPNEANSDVETPTPAAAEPEAVSPNEANSDATLEESEPSEPQPRPSRKSRSPEEPVGVVLMRLLAEEGAAEGGFCPPTGV